MRPSNEEQNSARRSGAIERLREIAQSRPPRVLIFANRGFGDLVCDTVLFAAFRQALPEARIAAVVRSSAHEAILAPGGLADEYLHFSADSDHYLRDALRLLRGIRRFRPDLMCVSTETDPVKSPVLSLLSGAKLRMGEAGSALGRLYTYAPPRRAEQHKVLSNWDILAAAGMDERPQPQVAVCEEDAQAMDRLASERRWPSAGPIAIHAGSRGIDTFKRWPVGHFAALIDRLSVTGDRPIVLVGGRDDAEEASAIRERVACEVDNLAATLSLGELAALFQRCSLVIGNDSGPMHIAAAVGAPSIVIFGPTCPERTRPWGDNVTVVRTGISCSPCFPRLRFGCGDPRCLTELEVDRVLEVAQSRLDRPAAAAATRLAVYPHR